ncbi:MAG TPA: 3-methylornithine--L-lysine ligase PylC [Candidatus Heimdallarchaeota archaeon]|nr:3-methylornithine--L-lysine ligase PylC [Candidatus Heimdallarchaeota archaeon]
MRVAVVGGKLQGVEAVYLALQAGWQVLLIDRAPDVPARGLAHSFIQSDITINTSDFSDIFKDIDLIIPALENDKALKSLKDLAKRRRFPLAYDEVAYAVTSSKQKSDSLFKELGLSAPQAWPDCDFPVIMKPSGLSGSQGIRKINNREELASIRLEENFDSGQWVIQEFLEGPSFSLEIVGLNGIYRTLQPTIIEVDRSFDCKRVVAPAGLSSALEEKFDDIAVVIAEALGLSGIMDIEVILHKNELKVLEVDARLPSQTPTAVLKSTGINMLELLYEIFNREVIPDIPPIVKEREVIYEHIRVSPDALEISGEHIISEARLLHHQLDFFGADEALTDFDPDFRNWVATLILTGKTKEQVAQKHRRVLETIRRTFGLRECADLFPEC